MPKLSTFLGHVEPREPTHRHPQAALEPMTPIPARLQRLALEVLLYYTVPPTLQAFSLSG